MSVSQFLPCHISDAVACESSEGFADIGVSLVLRLSHNLVAEYNLDGYCVAEMF